MIQATLVLIKPDGLKRSLTGNILTRLSETKLEIASAKIIRANRELAEKHYAQLRDKPFYGELIKYLMGELHDRKKVMAMVYHGENAIGKVRELSGATNPEEANEVSIRGAYGRIRTSGIYENVIHCSANEEEAEREIKLWFSPEEIVFPVYEIEEVILEKVKTVVWKQTGAGLHLRGEGQ